MLPFLAKNKNKMVSTLLDARSGDKTESNGDVDMDKSPESEGLRTACTAFLSAIERKSIPDLMAASKSVHNELHKQSPFSNFPGEEESDAADQE